MEFVGTESFGAIKQANVAQATKLDIVSVSNVSYNIRCTVTIDSLAVKQSMKASFHFWI